MHLRKKTHKSPDLGRATSVQSVNTLLQTSSWGTGTTTSTTSGNSTRLCPRKSDGWRERDF